MAKPRWQHRRIPRKGPVARIPCVADGQSQPLFPLYPANAVIFGPDGTSAILSGKGSLSILAFPSGNIAATYQIPNRMRVEAFRRALPLLLVTDNYEVFLVDGRSRRQITKFPAIVNVEFAATLSHNGRFVAVRNGKNTVIWDTHGQKKVRQYTNDEWMDARGISKPFLHFSPDGRYLASGSADSQCVIYELLTGREVSRFGPGRDVNTFLFSSDGGRAVLGWNDTAAVFDCATGREIVRVTHEGTVEHVGLSDDGRELVIAGAGVLTRHALAPSDLIRMTCSRLTRNLTPEEWQVYVAEPRSEKTCHFSKGNP